MSSEKKGECEFDQGGYFLIKGAEKVILYVSFAFSLVRTMIMFIFFGIQF